MSAVRTCSNCGVVSIHPEMDGTDRDDLCRKAGMGREFLDPRWRVRVFVCLECDTPTVELYPEYMAQSRRRQLMGKKEWPGAVIMIDGKPHTIVRGGADQ